MEDKKNLLKNTTEKIQNEAIGEKAPDKPKKELLQKAIRTYESDVAEVLGKGDTTVATMVIAEKNKKAQKAPIETKKTEEEERGTNPTIIRQFKDFGKESKEQTHFTRPEHFVEQKQLLEPSHPPLKIVPEVEPEPDPPPKPPKVEKAKPVVVPKKKLYEDEPYVEKHRTKKTLLALLSVALVISGLFGGYYLYKKSPIAKVEIQKPEIKIPSIIDPDSYKTLSVDSRNGDNLALAISNEFYSNDVGDGMVLELIFKEVMASSSRELTASRFLDKLDINPPDILKRSILDRWMMGVYEKDGQRLPFILLTTDFFQNAFAGMLKWETNLPDELDVILNYQDKHGSVRGTFEDKIIKNRDVREFRNQKGEILFLYSFINENTILITTSEAVVNILIDRIEKQAYIR